MSQVRRWRHREGKQPAQGNTAGTGIDEMHIHALGLLNEHCSLYTQTERKKAKGGEEKGETPA